MEDPAALRRLARFEREHPGVRVGHGEFGTWEAEVPQADGRAFAVRHTLPELLDRLDVITGAAA